MTDPVAGLVIAAGSSRRLGQPKQLLPFRGRTLLDATLDTARAAPFSQRLVTVGGAAAEVRGNVELDGFTVVESLHFRDGCASSVVSALELVADEVAGIVMLLGDQPGVQVRTIEQLIGAAHPEPAGSQPAPLAVCRYDDGIGHPFWLGRRVFADLAELHGDKAVWKLIESGRHPVMEVPIAGRVPLDVDTIEDYETLLADELTRGAT